MKKKYKIFLFSSFLLVFFLNSHELFASENKKKLPVISNSDACMNYYNKVSTSTNRNWHVLIILFKIWVLHLKHHR